MVHADSAGVEALQAIVRTEGPQQSTATVNVFDGERRVKAQMPADVQVALRRLLAQALVSDYLADQRPVTSKDGDGPPPDDNPKAAIE